MRQPPSRGTCAYSGSRSNSDAAPDAPISIDVDLTDALQGNWNWGDHETSGQLTSVEIALPRVRRDPVRLHDVVLEGVGTWS